MAESPFIGVISDTHGLLRQETIAHLTGADWLLAWML